jgi:hypothetical protein
VTLLFYIEFGGSVMEAMAEATTMLTEFTSIPEMIIVQIDLFRNTIGRYGGNIVAGNFARKHHFLMVYNETEKR